MPSQGPLGLSCYALEEVARLIAARAAPPRVFRQGVLLEFLERLAVDAAAIDAQPALVADEHDLLDDRSPSPSSTGRSSAR